jgi:hypothetical protein
MKLLCPVCLRQVSTKGNGAGARLAMHKSRIQVGWREFRGKDNCEGSLTLALPLRLAEARRDVSGFARVLAEAESALSKAIQQRDKAEQDASKARLRLAELEAIERDAGTAKSPAAKDGAR